MDAKSAGLVVILNLNQCIVVSGVYCFTTKMLVNRCIVVYIGAKEMIKENKNAYRNNYASDLW